MKSRFSVLAALALLVASVCCAAENSWTGWITDDMCGAKNAGEANAECASRGVKEQGKKSVFENEAEKRVSAVDAQDRVAPHAGHHVVVKGALDGNPLNPASIKMAK